MESEEKDNIHMPDNGFQNNANKPNENMNQFPDKGNFSASPNMPHHNFDNQVNQKPNMPKNNFDNQVKQKPNMPKNNNQNVRQNNVGKNNINNAKQNSAKQNIKNQAVKQGAKMAANAAAGPVGGAAVEAASKTKIGQKALNTVSNGGPFKKMNPLGGLFGKGKETEEEATAEGAVSIKAIKKIVIPSLVGGGGCSGCFSVVILAVIVTAILSPLFYIGELIGQASDAVSEFGEKLGNFLTFRGWCTDVDCDEKERNNFYEEIKEIYNDYKVDYNVSLNTQLIAATLTYSDPQITINNTQFDENGNLTSDPSSSIVDFKKGKKKVEDLAENMISQCCYENGTEHSCAVYPKKSITCPASTVDENGQSLTYTKAYKVDYVRYRAYLEDGFIKKYYYDDNDAEDVDEKVELTIDNIFERVDFYEFVGEVASNRRQTKVYGFCSGVTVTNSDGSINGTYSLEEYIAGVVTAEADLGYAGMESLKAQAIAARTYLLSYTDNCTKTIEASTRNQAFNPNINSRAKQATDETAGLVLLYDNQIFLSEYDSYCYNDENCTYGEEDGKYYVEYTKLPNYEKHRVYLSKNRGYNIIGGHGRGMSQLASYELDIEGYSYTDILEYFYSPGVTISPMITTISGEYTSNIQAVSNKEELEVRANQYAQKTAIIGTQIISLSDIYDKNASNLGQCVWFAQSRALELIISSNMGNADKLKAYNAILSTRANGNNWFSASTLDEFEKSTDYTKPRVGAIVSWSSSVSAGARHNYGHVAIIESVDEANQTVVIAESWNGQGADADNTWANLRYQTRTMTYEQLRNYNTGFTFNGYVYILG